jgi:CBS domain-containing protein
MSERNVERRVKTLMIRDVISVEPGDPVTDAVELMKENRVSAMPVVDSRGRCVGVISTTDILGLAGAAGGAEPDEFQRFTDRIPAERLAGPSAEGRRVRDVMTVNVVSVDPETKILDAAREMVRSRIHRLVVLDSDRRVLGILSTMDLLEALAAS